MRRSFGSSAAVGIARCAPVQARVGKFGARAPAWIDLPGRPESIERCRVARSPRALKAGIAIVPHAQLVENGKDRFGGALLHTRGINIFDAQQPATLVGAGIEVTGERGNQRSGVKRAGGRGCEPTDVAGGCGRLRDG
jgi:hypothetical protein